MPHASIPRLIAAFVLLFVVSVVTADEKKREPTVFEKLEADGVKIRRIDIVRQPIFDTRNAKQNRWFYRAANRVHVTTREQVIAAQLLFEEGDALSAQAIEETQRVLRRNSYLFDVSIVAVPAGAGFVDLIVTTRDNWTLFPQLGFSQQGGQSEYLLGVQESNLFGTGAELAASIADDGDRESRLLTYGNENFRGSWWRFELGFRDSDDGDSHRFRLFRPFFSLDSRWSAGVDVTSLEQEEPLFSFGDEVAEYQRDQTNGRAFIGWSRGLVDGWARRWTVGFAIDDNRFQPVFEPNRLVIQPADRELRYPFIRYEAIEDRFVTATNFTRIAITEDVFVGRLFSAELGWFGSTTGSDRDGAIFDLNGAVSNGDPTRAVLSLRGRARGRVEGGDLRNGRFSVTAGYVRRISDHRSWYVGLESTIAHEADLDAPVQLGGLTGLRGYDRAFANGDARAIATAEQRFITDWYPFQLFRIGAAAFVDVGRVWGDDITGAADDRLLANVGLGLRLMSTRAASNRMVHIDIAAPLRRDDNVDSSIQVSIQGKRGF
ncbi:MAG: BamA/TamA family outer membrane protein [Pseudomonadota bacterium]